MFRCFLVFSGFLQFFLVSWVEKLLETKMLNYWCRRVMEDPWKYPSNPDLKSRKFPKIYPDSFEKFLSGWQIWVWVWENFIWMWIWVADPALPHTDFSEKEIKCTWSLLSLFYFINCMCFQWLGALTVSTSAGLDRFSWIVVIFMFNSWCMYYFCGALTSVFTTFLCVFGYFLLPTGILFCLMFFFYFYLTLNLLDDLN